MPADQPAVRLGPVRVVASGLVAVAVALALLAPWLAGDVRAAKDPITGLQQLDLLYLDEPAPLRAELGIATGSPALLLICDGCERPDVEAQVVRTDDGEVARAYGLVTASGRVGPGYALIDAAGRVRYRTFDPDPVAHTSEILILLRAL